MLHPDFAGPSHLPLLETDDGVGFHVDAGVLSLASSYFADLLAALPKSSGQLNARIVVPVPGVSSAALAAVLKALSQPFTIPTEPGDDTYATLNGIAAFVAEFGADDIYDGLEFERPTLFLEYTMAALKDAVHGDETKLEPWIERLFTHTLPFGEFSTVALAAHVAGLTLKPPPTPPAPKCINDWCLAALRRHVPRALAFVGVYARQTEVLEALFTVDVAMHNATDVWLHDRRCLDAGDGVVTDDDYDAERAYPPLTRQLRGALHGAALRAAKLVTMAVTPPLSAATFVALAYTAIACAACRAEIRSGLVKTFVTRRPPRAWRAPLRECAQAQAAAVAATDATREDAEWFGYDGHGHNVPGQAEFYDLTADEPPPALSGADEIAILKQIRAHDEHAREVAKAGGLTVEFVPSATG